MNDRVNKVKLENTLRKSISSRKDREKTFEIKDTMLVSSQKSKITQNIETDSIYYLGNSLLDKIYYCPNNRSISIDNNDSQKIGLLLLGIIILIY